MRETGCQNGPMARPTIATTTVDLIEAHFGGAEPSADVIYVPAVVITAANAGEFLASADSAPASTGA